MNCIVARLEILLVMLPMPEPRSLKPVPTSESAPLRVLIDLVCPSISFVVPETVLPIPPIDLLVDPAAASTSFMEVAKALSWAEEAAWPWTIRRTPTSSISDIHHLLAEHLPNRISNSRANCLNFGLLSLIEEFLSRFDDFVNDRSLKGCGTKIGQWVKTVGEDHRGVLDCLVVSYSPEKPSATCWLAMPLHSQSLDAVARRSPPVTKS